MKKSDKNKDINSATARALRNRHGVTDYVHQPTADSFPKNKNKMKKDSIIFYRSFYESIKELQEDYQLEIYNSIFEYSLNFNEPELEGISKAIFTLIKPQLDANNQRFVNGLKGGRPKKEQNQKETKIKPKQNQKETEQKPKRNQSKTKPEPNVNVNVNVNNNDNFNENENLKKKNQKKEIELNFENIEKKMWEIWINYKKNQFKFTYKTPASEQIAINQLIKLSENDNLTAKKIIEQSIANGWKGLFALQQSKNQNITKNGNIKIHDEDDFDFP